MFIEEYDITGNLISQVLLGGTANDVEPVMDIDRTSGYLYLGASSKSKSARKNNRSPYFAVNCNGRVNPVVSMFQLSSTSAMEFVESLCLATSADSAIVHIMGGVYNDENQVYILYMAGTTRLGVTTNVVLMTSYAVTASGLSGSASINALRM